MFEVGNNISMPHITIISGTSVQRSVTCIMYPQKISWRVPGWSKVDLITHLYNLLCLMSIAPNTPLLFIYQSKSYCLRVMALRPFTLSTSLNSTEPIYHSCSPDSVRFSTVPSGWVNIVSGHIVSHDRRYNYSPRTIVWNFFIVIYTTAYVYQWIRFK